ncbi:MULTISPECIES: alcohol dehydrogenase catalytic domain-containing protein [Aerococcus]|uniref:Alcohol dehydrogenase catalytic domain-containing protein n=1 Tax=Aerococcus sanguinicola TaxID=119206 RepID=A0A5N1GNL0_9LACT|nr:MULTISPECIES: alcohol dehydrogenase catalytic domain-containing protein [Aerococcus]KAA9302382.1 alcohol dehydrogenase catalytic domain-containing protein [Aerococcus sanguinicola]MDK6369756.1 alcohol dehydrogenase catalytic domain-containing protein [Aerococcus sp. UMB9870]MDK6680396.1 alcohol dehydrogenase catalytic domain-containing protein [Aerococcus sp. UMB8608]MDK6687107.1 alcohol dehydrogenase catalytic domain-containing protein [Aerococcus sp. UMB8623]MDK6940326.1 alcohol dehydroge
MKSKAAVAFGPNDLRLVEVDVEDPHPGEVMVKIAYTSVCHTDIYTLSGDDPSAIFPCILGHEAAGEVVKVGEGVKSVEVGDHVIPLWKPECGKCEYCQKGLNFCSAISETQGQGVMPDGTPRFSYEGKPIYHFMGTSTFSEYTVLPEIALTKIDPEVAMDEVCLLGCGVTTGIGAVRNDAAVYEEATAAVFGIGTLGLAAIQELKRSQAERIIAVDIDPNKAEIARDFGATDFINSSELDRPVQEEIIALTDGGVDFSFVCVGNTDVMNAGLEATHKGWGESVIMGVAAGNDKISTRPFQLITGRTWLGTSFGGVTGRTGLSELVAEYAEGGIDLKAFISHRIGFDEIEQAIEWQENGESLRDILSF